MDRHLRAHRSDYSAMPHAFVYYRFRSRRQRQEWPNPLVQKPRALVILVLVQLTTNAPIHYGKERGVGGTRRDVCETTAASCRPRSPVDVFPLWDTTSIVRSRSLRANNFDMTTDLRKTSFALRLAVIDRKIYADYTYLYIHLGTNDDDFISHACV